MSGTRPETSLPAVLFDVGGPIDTETTSERLIDRDIRAALRAEGVHVSEAAYDKANRRAVDQFAPDTYRASIWSLTGGDRGPARRAYARFRADVSARRLECGGVELRPRIAALLTERREHGVSLALVAHQPASAVFDLEAAALAGIFDCCEESGYHACRRPDVWLFVTPCGALDLAAEESVMVGDRIDNDIMPAAACSPGATPQGRIARGKRSPVAR